MRAALPGRLVITIILVLALLPVSLTWGAPLLGPPPPAPPPVPTSPATGYDHYTIIQAPQGNPDQIVFGTPDNDMIAEYGDTDTASQYAEGSAGNDWILQVGGLQKSDQTAMAGDGNDTIYQFGGHGDSTQFADGGTGNQTFIQGGDRALMLWKSMLVPGQPTLSNMAAGEITPWY